MGRPVTRRRVHSLVLAWGGFFAAGLLVGSCARPGTKATTRPSEFFTIRTAAGGEQMTLGPGGVLTGPTLQLSPSREGYRGMAGSSLVDLRSSGERIVGTMHGQIVDLHIDRSDEGGLVARGLFAGRLGRIEASNYFLRSTLGICGYQLEAVGQQYQGQRACRAGFVPSIHPVIIELPAGFERLPWDRQVMVLAVLLTL